MDWLYIGDRVTCSATVQSHTVVVRCTSIFPYLNDQRLEGYRVVLSPSFLSVQLEGAPRRYKKRDASTFLRVSETGIIGEPSIIVTRLRLTFAANH